MNKVILIGNCGRDPEVRALPSGGKVVDLSLATSSTWNDRGSGERQERTEWHRVVFFSPLAEIVEQYVKKGTSLYVEGSLRYRESDKDGVKRYFTDIVARDLNLLSPAGGGSGGNSGGGYARAPREGDSAPSSGAPATAPHDYKEALDDDLPF